MKYQNGYYGFFFGVGLSLLFLVSWLSFNFYEYIQYDRIHAKVTSIKNNITSTNYEVEFVYKSSTALKSLESSRDNLKVNDQVFILVKPEEGDILIKEDYNFFRGNIFFMIPIIVLFSVFIYSLRFPDKVLEYVHSDVTW